VIYFFDVTPKKPPDETSNLGFYLWLVSSAATVIVSSYGMFSKVSPWINTHSEKILEWWTRNKGTIAIAIIVAILDVVLFVLRV